MKVAVHILGVSIVMLSSASYAFAGAVAAPEIDPSSIAGGLGLLAGGLFIARARWRSK